MKEHDVRTWTEEMRYLWSERACIMEFDGGMPQWMAEAAARREIWRKRYYL